MNISDIKPGLKFKAIQAIEYKTERGNDFGEPVGEVISSNGVRVELKGLMYNFSTSCNQFLYFNKFKN